MAYSTIHADEILRLYLLGTAIPNIAINATAAPATAYYMSMHTAPPTAGNQATSEVAYLGYARLQRLRDATAWTIVDGIATPSTALEYAELPAGTADQVVTHLGLGLSLAGAGRLMLVGALPAPVTLRALTVPRIKAGTQLKFI